MRKGVKKQKNVGELLCTVYLCLLGTALPLAVHNAYYDITRTKATVFWILSGALLAAAMLRLCLDPAARAAFPRLAAPDWLFLVFALMHVLSTLLFRAEAGGFFASDNRFQGILSFALYPAVFLLLRRDGALTRPVRFALGLGFSLAALLGVTELFGGDLLGLRMLSPVRELPRFLSTVGNISFFSALCVLFLPLEAYYALSAETPRAALVPALCALLALWGGMASRAEGFVLGALAFFLLLPLLTKDTRALRRVPLLWAAAALAGLLFAVLMESRSLYPPSELTRLLCSPFAALPILALSAALYLLLRSRDEAAIARVRKLYTLLFCLLLFAGVVFLVLANTLLRERLHGPLASVAVFSSAWGSDRGAEWISFWRMFREAPWAQKLIGSGAGSLAAWDRGHRLFSDAVTDSAHNEYLHYLLTGGVLGLAAYAALLFLALRRALRAPSRGRTALGLACAAYAVQAAVNLAQPFTTPLFFALLALLLRDGEPEADAQKDSESSVFACVALCALAFALLLGGALSSKAGSKRLAAQAALSAASFAVEQSPFFDYNDLTAATNHDWQVFSWKT